MFCIQPSPIQIEKLRAQCLADRAGAYTSFEGWVRDLNEGQKVNSLEYEAYQVLAEKEGTSILAEARERWDILSAVAEHRVGHLAIGDCAIYVGVSSQHRAAAFEACRYIVDSVKDRVPIWKKEHYTSGSTEWINCHKTIESG
ncbi:MAG: molybdenum cofactor biosynthesis protein MoaE [Verrucomicrobiota bacterium]